MTKNTILILGVFGTLFLVVGFSLGAGICSTEDICIKIFDIINNDFVNNENFVIIFLTPIFFVFSLLTYWKEDSVFRAWWNPARFWVATIIVATIVTTIIDESRVGSSIGDFPMSIPVLGLLYTLFIVTSLINIVRAYRR